MQKIIEYLAANPFYTTVLVASAIVIAIAVLIIIIAYKSRNSKRKNEKIEISDNYFPSLGQDAKETPENIVNPEIFDNPERKNAEQTVRTASADVQTKTADEDALPELKDEPKAELKAEQKAEPQKHEKQRSPRPAANASKPIKDGASAEKLFADR